MDVDEPSTSPTAAAELQAPMSGLRISTNASRALSPARLSRPTRPPVEPSPASSSGRLDGSPPQGVRVSILASECGVTVAMAGGVLGTPVAEFQLDPDFDYDNVSLTPKWVVPR